MGIAPFEIILKSQLSLDFVIHQRARYQSQLFLLVQQHHLVCLV